MHATVPANTSDFQGCQNDRLFTPQIPFLCVSTPAFYPLSLNRPIFDDVGVPQAYYRYFDRATRGLDFSGMCEDLEAAPDGSVIMLQGAWRFKHNRAMYMSNQQAACF